MSDTPAHLLDQLERHVPRCPWGCRPAEGDYCPVGVGLYRTWKALEAMDRDRTHRRPEVRIDGVLVVPRLTPVWVRTGADQMLDDAGPEYAEARVLRGPNRVGKLIFWRPDTGRVYRSYETHVASVGLSPAEQDAARGDYRARIAPEWRRTTGTVIKFPRSGDPPP